MARADARRGEIWWVDWSPGRGSEQLGRRPALVIQSDAANKNPQYPNTIVATVSTTGRSVATHVALKPSKSNGLKSDSYVKCEQVMTISKERLEKRVGSIDARELEQVNEALCTVLSIRFPP